MHEEFFLQILKAYCESFHFGGSTFDAAFRQFLVAFRLPGLCWQTFKYEWLRA